MKNLYPKQIDISASYGHRLSFLNQACDTTARIQFVISYTPLSQLSAMVEWFSNFSSGNSS